ncbi:MAG: hypothetical protein QM730_11075 [Anaerolineales bacterium]
MTLCLGSSVILIVGVLSVFAKDIMWELTQWNNSLKGISSTRTPSWDTMTTIGGVVALIIGALGIYIFFTSGG